MVYVDIECCVFVVCDRCAYMWGMWQVEFYVVVSVHECDVYGMWYIVHL